jgi:hypothetical protein
MTMTTNMSTFGLTAAVALVLSVVTPARASADCGGPLDRLQPGAMAQADARSSRNTDARKPFPFFPDDPSIVGLWSVTLTSGGTVIDVGYDAWHADGLEILNDASPISHNVCLGVWKQTARRTFELKHPALRFDASGNMIGTLVLRETNVVNRAGDRFTGTFTIEFFDLNGTSVFTGAGEIAGTRITVE